MRDHPPRRRRFHHHGGGYHSEPSARQDYLDYVPASTDTKVRELWTKLVHQPVYNAVNRYHPILKKHKMMDQVFRFQDLDALVDKLEAGTKILTAMGMLVSIRSWLTPTAEQRLSGSICLYDTRAFTRG